METETQVQNPKTRAKKKWTCKRTTDLQL